MSPDPVTPRARLVLPEIWNEKNLNCGDGRLGFMVLLAVALAGLLWERLENIPFQLRAIPIGVLVLSILFAVYAYGRRREVSELKGLLRGLQEHVGAAPSEEQLDQLSQVIMRSQRNFKELIDSFDDPACAVSLDGTLRTVNKRITEMTGLDLFRAGRAQDLRFRRRADAAKKWNAAWDAFWKRSAGRERCGSG